MTQKEMWDFTEIHHSITKNGVRIDFSNGSFDVGYFELFDDAKELREKNEWRYVPNNLSVKYRETKSKEYTRIAKGDDIVVLTVLESFI